VQSKKKREKYKRKRKLMCSLLSRRCLPTSATFLLSSPIVATNGEIRALANSAKKQLNPPPTPAVRFDGNGEHSRFLSQASRKDYCLSPSLHGAKLESPKEKQPLNAFNCLKKINFHLIYTRPEDPLRCTTKRKP
jgi:hypothetical protein